ncbi:MAG: thiamine pyrophosphate-dependent enzyme, partial [Terracidiphilus sp.]
PSCSLPAIVVDAHDAVALYRVAQEAIAHARRGGGPTMIACTPFRAAGASVNKRTGDPIAKMERYLAGKGLPASRLKAAVTAGFSRELDAAVEAAGRPVPKQHAC